MRSRALLRETSESLDELPAREAVRRVIAEAAGVDPGALDDDEPLAHYGFDSVTAVEIAAELERRLGRTIPDGLLFETGTLAELGARLFGELRPGDPRGTVDRMRADGELPQDIRPGEPSLGRLGCPGTILLTGATGLVGAFVLQEILDRTPSRVICLVRCRDREEGWARLREARARFGLGAASSDWEWRVRVEPGDLARPRLGLREALWEGLSEEVEAICHAAAEVNWTASYEALRAVNVLAVRDLLELACRKRVKPLVYLSSLAVCYSTTAPARMRETDDPMDYAEGLHLGYAQSKCAAEALARTAQRRGLPVTILRPALISGDCRTGRGNAEDFLARFFLGCIQMGCAPDLDWMMDCCPADHVADVIARSLFHPIEGGRTLHLLNPGKRHWREAVLWMNLFGYPIRLVPYAEWLSLFEDRTGDAAFALRPLRAFFRDRPEGAKGLTLPECYEEGRRSVALAEQTKAALDEWRARCPPLNGRLLERYFLRWIEDGIFPEPPGAAPGGRRDANESRRTLGADFFNKLQTGNERPKWIRAEEIWAGAESSIITEMTAWTSSRARGVFRYRLYPGEAAEMGREARDVLVKLKPSDREIMRVGERVASLCDPELGRLYGRFQDRLGFAGCHARELALYRQEDPRFRRFSPACLGTVSDEENGTWALALEFLHDLAFMDSTRDLNAWNGEAILAAIEGLAALQAIWFGRGAEFAAQSWSGMRMTTAAMTEMKPLWLRLVEFSGAEFNAWAGKDLSPLRRELIETMPEWWPRLEAQQTTMIHNDFNPRNLAFRAEGGRLRLCVYDWELAAWGAPQHDLAELLCFVLPERAGRGDVEEWVEAHRRSLGRETGQEIPAAAWVEGFRLSLWDLMAHRLPLYCLAHRFRRQGFLPRVIRNWGRLFMNRGLSVG